jgi:hypothetical protein
MSSHLKIARDDHDAGPLFVAGPYGWVECDRNMTITHRDKLLYSHPHPQHWHWVRAQCLERDRWRCVTCFRSQNLEMHHRTYARFGFEEVSDLYTLCNSCHAHISHRRSA